jgi:hypothetical protein
LAGGFQGHDGGISGLLELIDQHREAVEFDLIALGLRLDWLGTERLSWRDLLVVVNQSPRWSALSRAMNPEGSEWGLSEHLLAAVFDSLERGNWQRAGRENAPRPKPFPRPGVTEDKQQTHGSTALPMDEMARRLGWEEAT